MKRLVHLATASVLLASCGGEGSGSQVDDEPKSYSSVEDLATDLGEECAGNLDIGEGASFVVQQARCFFDGTQVQLSIYEDTAAINQVLVNRKRFQEELDKESASGSFVLVYGDKWSVSVGDDQDVAEAIQEITGGAIDVVGDN